MKEVLNDSSNEVKIVVIWSLTETVRINPSLVQETLKILNTLLNNPSNYIEFTITKILGWIIQINPNISHDASKILKNLFSNSDYIIKSESALSLVELGKVKPAEEAFKVFKDILSDPYVDRYAKYEAAWNLIEILKVMLVNKGGHKQFNELKIIYLTKIEAFQFDEDLHTKANTILHKITDHIISLKNIRKVKILK
ncbi:HEAT repeats family protein [Rickettsia amblyommatis str. Darkwater]|uniref:HEAT repeats family protein n=2 Tax=Rickettsia amblyommatis TaxID=33989 RepID=H8K5V9_RICAG|nr:hypothetical protein [Rickettsia amblyommatis]AFC69903.1 hypothetical protein MCE_05225 [Rickettsia amblyommatis str. GAT-30V]KJV62393.1 HEAT repeats family protein [Rickettsia amblyommatis str. Ac/Pa]KJV91323.1 HEAT repeats family protein [Rickettsia amblyommatis str. Darkwater]